MHDRLWGLYEWAASRNRLRWLFIGFLITIIGFYFRNEYLKDESQGRFVPFDGWFHYVAADFEAEVRELSLPGRRMYIATELSLDLIYPALYLMLFGAWLALLARPPRGRTMQHAAFLPLIAAVADLLENVIVSYLIWEFDRFQALRALVSVAAVGTSVKWASLIILAALLMLSFASRRIKKPD